MLQRNDLQKFMSLLFIAVLVISSVLTTPAATLTAYAEGVDKTALETAIAEAEAKKIVGTGTYTQSSIAALKEVLEDAETVYADSAATQEQVDATTENLKNAIDALVERGNKTTLSNAIKDAKALNAEDYSDRTYKVLADAIAKAEALQKEMDTNADITAFQVQTAISDLENAEKQLVNVKELRALVKKTEENKDYGSKAGVYTAASLEKVNTALATAKSALEVAEKKEVVDKAIKDLQDAIDALVAQPVPRIVGNTYFYDLSQFYYSKTDKTPVSGYDTKDDTVPLQWALDRAADDHYTVITVPAGTYYISDSLYIHSNTTLQLANGATIVRTKYSKNMLKVSRAGDYSYDTSAVGGYDLAANITITGGIWDGGAISTANSSTNLIYIGHARNVTISNTTIRNCRGSHALEFAGVTDSTVTGCTFYGFLYGNDNYTSEAVQLDICRSDWAPGYKSDSTTCKNINITYNTIYDYPRGIGSHHSLASAPYENIVIENNNIFKNPNTNTNMAVAGIFLTNMKNVTVRNNVITDYSRGIWAKSSKQMTIKKNKIKFVNVNTNGHRSIVYSGCDVKNQTIGFDITSTKIKSKTLKFKAPGMKKGNVKVKGKTYKFNKKKKSYTFKLKTKIKKNMKMTFYGKDKNGNQFYRTYRVPKGAK